MILSFIVNNKQTDFDLTGYTINYTVIPPTDDTLNNIITLSISLYDASIDTKVLMNANQFLSTINFKQNVRILLDNTELISYKEILSGRWQLSSLVAGEISPIQQLDITGINLINWSE